MSLLQRARAADREAQRALVQLGSLKVARVLIDGSDDDRLALWRGHGRGARLPVAILPVLFEALGSAPPATIERAFEQARRGRAAELADDELLAIADFVRAHAAAVPLREALAVVEWGLDDPRWLRGPGAVADRFTAAGVRALEGAASLEEVRWHGGLQRVLARAAVDEGAALLADRWLLRADFASLTAQAWFAAHGQLERAGGLALIATVIPRAWERSDDRATLATALADATGRNRGQAATGGLVDWVWSRMCERPDERALLYRGFRPWRDELIERRNATPRARRPGGASAADHLAVWGALDLERLGTTLDETLRLITPADWPGLVDVIFALPRGATTPDERMAALVGIGQLGHQLRNRVMTRDAVLTPDEDAAVTTWRDRAHALAQQLRADGAVLDRDHGNRVADYEDTVALIDRTRAERAAAAAEAQRRAADNQLRADERAAREAARAARDEAQRTRDEARRVADEAARAQVAQVTAATASIAPTGAVEPIDREPFFAALALPTLLDYTRAMVRLQRGADVMALFAELGLDATSWSSCVQSWSSLFIARPDLAQRFAALLSGGWQ